MHTFITARAVPTALLLGALVAAGCGQSADDAPVQGSLSIQLSRSRVALGSPVDVTYKFTLAGDAAGIGARKVFVHFMDANGEQMWTDDHEPPTPTTAWKPGQAVEYTRTVFAPVYPYVGQAAIVAGLYDPANGERVRLAGTDAGGRAYEAATFELLPQTENIFLIFKDGWHAVESAADNSMVEWQWTKKEATLAFRNPRRDAVLYFQADNPSKAATAATSVELRLGDQVLTTVPLGAEGAVLKIPLTAAAMGGGDMVELRFVVDQTFVPALEPGTQSNDPRELGARVF
ncbi:MAG TPA: hypothetical protein VMW48_18505, partial [Vicinamibacterales bacterium]|nr:hypothetical protein [Vicinamibacterales bacterium]